LYVCPSSNQWLGIFTGVGDDREQYAGSTCRPDLAERFALFIEFEANGLALDLTIPLARKFLAIHLGVEAKYVGITTCFSLLAGMACRSARATPK